MKINFFLTLCLLSFFTGKIALSQSSENYYWDNIRMGGGGAIPWLTAHPAQPGLYYAGTDVGDVYRWDKQETRWFGLLGFIPWDPYLKGLRYGIESIAIDGSDPNIIYAAVGGTAWVTNGKGFLLKSVDQGKTWKETNLRTWNGSYWSQRQGQKILIDPNNHNIVYFASREGLFISKNRGDTWQVHPTAPIGCLKLHSPGGSYAQWIAADKTGGICPEGQSKILYIGLWNKGTFCSTNGGKTWDKIADFHGRRAEVSSKGVLYIADDTGVYRYQNNIMESITPVHDVNYGCVTIDPSDPDHIICVVHKYSLDGNFIYRSVNGGQNWKKVEMKFSKVVPWWKSGYYAASIFQAIIDPFNSKQLTYTNWYGVMRTNDITADTCEFYDLTRGIEETVSIGGGASPPSGPVKLFSGTGDVGGFAHINFNEYPIAYRQNGAPLKLSVMGVAFQENNPNFVVLVGRDGWKGPGLAAYSNNGGFTWKSIDSIPGNGGRVAVSASSPRILWLPQEQIPYYSIDSGKTWVASKGVPIGTMPGTRIFRHEQPLAADKVNGNVFYIYDGKTGDFYRSDNGAEGFTKVSTIPTPKGEVYDFATITFQKVESAPGLAGEVWVSLNDNGLYRSSDFGQKFTKIENIQRAYTFSFGKNAPGKNNPTVFVYGIIKNRNGIFRSDDMGRNWVEISNENQKIGNDPRVMVGDRQVYGRVFIGTGGSGYFYGERVVK